ncbi:MAG: hypothetical protein ABL891_18525 [Burkholderiales bacterium]
MKSLFAALAVAGLMAISGCASTGPAAPVNYAGGVMVNAAGMTVYTFDKDPAGSGRSVCNGQCATNWPPLRAGAEDKPGGDFSIVTRDDYSKQWAHKGKPLYLWIKDKSPGDKTGDGFGKVWWVVKQ